MALKDWKKETDEEQQVSWFKKDGSFATISKRFGVDRWGFYAENSEHKRVRMVYGKKGFKTKSQALGYAKQYMRTH